jgi:WD40 repeat protein
VQTCKQWRRLAEDESLWRLLYKRTFHSLEQPKLDLNDNRPLKRKRTSWKDIYKRKKTIEENWLKGKYHIRHVLHGHNPATGHVRCLRFRNDLLVTGSSDKTAKVWDMRTGKCRHTIEGHRSWINALRWNEQYLVLGGGDAVLSLWNWNEGTPNCISRMTGHKGWINCLDTNFETQQFYTGSFDCTIKLWDARSGTCTETLSEHQNSVRALQVLDQMLVSGDNDGIIKIWDLRKGGGGCMRSIRQASKAKKGVISLQFDRERLVCSHVDARIQEFPMEWCLYHQPPASDLSLSSSSVPSPSHLRSQATSGESTGDDSEVGSGNVLIASPQTCRTLEGHEQEVWGLQFDETKIISGACDKTVRIWGKADFGRDRDSWGGDGHVSKVIISDEVEELGPVLCLQFDQHTLVTGSHNCSVVIWDFSGSFDTSTPANPEPNKNLYDEPESEAEDEDSTLTQGLGFRLDRTPGPSLSLTEYVEELGLSNPFDESLGGRTDSWDRESTDNRNAGEEQGGSSNEAELSNSPTNPPNQGTESRTQINLKKRKRGREPHSPDRDS